MFYKIIILILISLSSLHSNELLEEFSLNNESWGQHDKVPNIAIAGIVTTGLLIGNDTRFGNTVWQSIDSLLIGGVITHLGKHSFRRVRPYEKDLFNDQWFQDGNDSFPSGHTASITSLVTPFIFEYANEEPLTHLLWLLPVQQMIGRVHDKKHYKSDVLTGFAVGALSGWIANQQETPLTLSWSDNGIYTGVSFDF